ncbi:hypothetical protein ACF06Q_08735 [Streptomyces leeuwenhoekii]|uniref:hypothetical protein n=1 Tax=Streptomyces leeuwenhoekii TaxID=1437453 RepID=UPI0036F7912E
MTTLRSASSKPLLPDLERDVLAPLAEGHRGPEVAARLGLANSQRVHYRIHRISTHFGLEAASQPQLVDPAYALGALPAPGPVQPLVLRAAEYHLVRMVAAGGTLTEHARKQGLSVFQANYIARKAQSALDAATLPTLIRRAWQRQILGPTAFAADLARMRAQQPAEPDLGGHVIVPLASGHRLALPAWGPHPTRFLDVPDEVEAQAAARFLSARDGYAHLRITPLDRPGGLFRVSWRRQEATPSAGHGLVLGRPRKPPLYQDSA